MISFYNTLLNYIHQPAIDKTKTIIYIFILNESKDLPHPYDNITPLHPFCIIG